MLLIIPRSNNAVVITFYLRSCYTNFTIPKYKMCSFSYACVILFFKRYEKHFGALI